MSPCLFWIVRQRGDVVAPQAFALWQGSWWYAQQTWGYIILYNMHNGNLVCIQTWNLRYDQISGSSIILKPGVQRWTYTNSRLIKRHQRWVLSAHVMMMYSNPKIEHDRQSSLRPGNYEANIIELPSWLHTFWHLFGIFLGVTIILFVTFTLGTINCGYHRIIPWSPQVVTNLSEAPGSGSIVDLKTRPHVGERHPTFVQWIKKNVTAKTFKHIIKKHQAMINPLKLETFKNMSFPSDFPVHLHFFPKSSRCFSPPASPMRRRHAQDLCGSTGHVDHGADWQGMDGGGIAITDPHII